MGTGMGNVVHPPIPRLGVTFELDRLEVEGDHLVVSGRWTGVRGMRFVRPTLVVGGRQILATLEHKPWTPTDQPWIAAFPWDHARDVTDVALVVAPSVTVPLVPAVEDVFSSPPQEVDAEQRLRQLEADMSAQRDELRALADEVQALRRQLDGAHS
jgi:hypothetical protein